MRSTHMASPSSSPFAANLRTALACVSPLTQEQLARQLGVTLGAVSAWVRGRSEPTGAKLVLLAAALDRDPAWFFTDHAPEDVAA